MSIKQDLLEGIEFIVKNYIENAPFDKTRVGIIQGVSSNNAYTVKIDNRIFNNVPYLGNGTLGLNTTVRVVVPENQMNNIVILGTTQKEDTPIVVAVSSVNGKTGDVILNIGDIPNLNKTLEQKYSALNPPPYPVKSINGMTGEVVLFIPSKTSQLLNDSDYQNSTQMNTAISIEVSNRKSADDSLQAQITSNDTDISNLQNTKANIADIPTNTSDLVNDSGFLATIPSEYITDTEMQIYAQPKGDYATNTILTNGLSTKLPLSGGTMTGNINMGSNYINNLPDAITNQQPATFKQLNDAIAGLGTVFDLKGSVATVSNLQTTGNVIGDVWYVEDESVGYIWLEDTTGTLRWEKFGEEIDLSGYMTKAGLLQTTGSVTDNAMSQNATTVALSTKADTADLADVAFSGLYSDLTSTPASLPASDVYSWAKQPTKPTYTASEVGLGNVSNVTTNNQTPTWTIASTLANLVSGELLSIAFGKIAKSIQSLISHITNVSNPHSVTKSQIGLGNVDNTSDANKPISTATQNVLNLKANSADLSEVATTGNYNDLTNKPNITNTTYNMNTTESTNNGKINLIGSDGTTETLTLSGRGATNIISNNANGVIISSTDTTYSDATTTTDGLMSSSDKVKLNGVANNATNVIDSTTNGNILVNGVETNVYTLPNDVVANSFTGNTSNATNTFTASTTLTTLTTGEKLSISLGKVMKAISDLISHITNVANPHNITKTQIGLGNVDNTSDADKPISTATQSILDLKANTSSLSTVATTGAYKDLLNKPLIDTSLNATSTNAVQNAVVTNSLNTKAPINHADVSTIYGVSSESNYGHAMASSSMPLVASVGNIGVDNGKFAREGHIHPAQTSVSGNAGSATKLQTARTINNVNFDGTKDITIYDNTKLPLNGGKMSGTLSWENGLALPQFSGAPTYLLGVEEFVSGGITKWQHKDSIEVGKAGRLATPRTINGVSFDGTINIETPLKGNSDVMITSPVNSQILQFDGTKWVNADPQSFSQQQANWNETNISSVQYIQNKPTSLPANGGNADTLDGKHANDFALKNSPVLTGVPTAPTAPKNTSTSQIATTEFVQRKVEEETINIQVSTIQPINQKAGDIWYRVL